VQFAVQTERFHSVAVRAAHASRGPYRARILAKFCPPNGPRFDSGFRLPVFEGIRLHVSHASAMVRRRRRTTMTTKDGGELTAMGLFRVGLDHDIKTREDSLRRKIESLKRDLDRALAYLDSGHRVNSAGVAQYNAIEIDRLCATLNQLYDLRISLNGAIEHDAKDGAK
jgi:hypothetical protein